MRTIICFNEKQWIGNGLTIPSGPLRESLSALKKADGLVVGSALCKEISTSLKNGKNPVTTVSNMVKNLRRKLS